MPTPAPLKTKFVRYHETGISVPVWQYWLRLIYEFWGFCVNGTNDLKHPGGFPTGSAPNIHLGTCINMAAGWESGSSILLYSNSNGSTLEGMPWFTGSNFLQSHVGKYLTVWKSGSACSDDSIYKITGLMPPNALTSSVITVDINQGGTPFTGSNKPSFTARTNINYRVIDFAAVASLGFMNDSNYIVLQLNGAPYVNAGQRNSQVRMRLATFRGDNFPRGLSFLMSPSGSWNGTQFTEGLSGGNSLIGVTPTNIGEVGPQSGNTFDWANSGGGTGAQGIVLFGAQDFLSMYGIGGVASGGSGFHIEIPQRLYPYEYDPNPICMAQTSYGLYMTNPAFAGGFGAGFFMITADNKPNRHWTTIHHQAGDFYNTSITDQLAGYANGLYNNMFFNVFTNKFYFSDGVLFTNESLGQHYLARARLRRIKFIAPIIPAMHRLGDQGEWLHVNGGVLWSWDGAVLPGTIFRTGGP